MSVTSGWGRLTWGQANWNSAVTLKTGWGAKSWGEDEWDELKDAVAQPSGLSISASVGSVTVDDVHQGLTIFFCICWFNKFTRHRSWF